MGSFQWMFQVVSSVIPLDDVMWVQGLGSEACTYPSQVAAQKKTKWISSLHSCLYKGTVHI